MHRRGERFTVFTIPRTTGERLKFAIFGVIEGNRPATDNDWEVVKRGGDTAIARWIRDQMKGKSCTIVLVGTNTAGRKWINYEN